MKVNEARGEVLAEINGAKIVLCASMEGLAMLEASIGETSMIATFRRIGEIDVIAILAAIRCLSRDDCEPEKFIEAIPPGMESLLSLKTPILRALAGGKPAEKEDPEGNAPSAGENPSTGSPGASGKDKPSAS